MNARPAIRFLLAALFFGQLFQATVCAAVPWTLTRASAPPAFATELGADQSFSQLPKSSAQDGAAISASHFTLLPRQQALSAPCTELEPYRLPGFFPLALRMICQQQTSADL